MTGTLYISHNYTADKLCAVGSQPRSTNILIYKPLPDVKMFLLCIKHKVHFLPIKHSIVLLTVYLKSIWSTSY